jgi:hypothetical protein
MRAMRLIALPAATAAIFASASACAATTPSAEAAGLRLLTWPGKVAAPDRPRRRESPAEAPRPAAASPAPAVTPAALPTSIYSPAPPAAAPSRPAAPPVQRSVQAPVQAPVLAQAQTTQPQPPSGLRNDAASPRFYSLHRAYGQAPDPVALSSQFFATPTPDLAEPPPPPPRTVTTSNGQVVRTTSGASDSAVN